VLRFRTFRRLLPLAGCLVAACAVGQPAVPMQAFVSGDLETVCSFAEREAVEGDEENLALLRNVQAQCEMLLGRTDDARRHFEEAGGIMGSWAVSGGEATAAIIGSESSKIWRGDPYEKAMNAFYLGLCYLWKGEPDNARAACKRGILMDAEVGDETYQADTALLFWMAGRMSALMGNDEAADFFREAAAANEFAIEHTARGVVDNPVLEHPGDGNLVLILECGMGPEKYADGIQEELARFRPRPHAAVAARASVDGRDLGTASLVLDVDYQARTLGGTAMEGIRQGKAVFKTVSTTAGAVLLVDSLNDRDKDRAQTKAIVGGALLLAGLLTSSAADIRHWPTLPSTVHVLTAKVPPGEHLVEVDFLDVRGRPLSSLRQSFRVAVPERGEAWHLCRSLPPRQAATAVP
jgi:hypothetical protein